LHRSFEPDEAKQKGQPMSQPYESGELLMLENLEASASMLA
jgi:hypothetical protein